ncbi:MAG TPA: sugar-binding protein [bacterium]|nr:sugar-binding protein [bacterium]
MKNFRAFLPILFFALTKTVFAQFGGDGLKGVYYINTNLTNAAATVVDPIISYRWNGCPPQPGMSSTSFSVRWTGQVEPVYSEPYTFYADVNGGVSVIVNGVVLVNQWTDKAPPIFRYMGAVTLTAGVKVPIEIDYFTNGANPTSDLIQFGWQSASQGQAYVTRDFLFSGSSPVPFPTPVPPYACQASVSVDGSLDEWAWNTPFGWNQVGRTVLGNTYGSTASFKVLWDPANLYLGVSVQDSQLTNTGAAPYQNSAVELYLDTTDSKTVTVNSSDFEYFFRWNDTAATESQGRTTGVSMVTSTIAGGYVLEASIPWSTLGIAGPSPGTALGLDLGVDVNHNGGNCRDGQLIWNGGSDDYADAGGYGQLTLTSACPTPLATPPPPRPGLPYVSPNPSDGDTVKFVYEMAEAGTARIKVWNAWGNLAATLEEAKGAGLQSSLLHIAAFAPGHYFYRIELRYASGRTEAFKTQVLAVKK